MSIEMTPAERLIAAVNCREPDVVPVSLNFKPIYVRKWLQEKGRPMSDDLAARIESEIEFFSQWPDVVPSLTGPSGQGAVGLLSWLDRKALPSDTPPPSQHWSIAEVKGRLKKAKIPDPYRDGWMPEALADWQRHIENIPAAVRRKYGSLIWMFSMLGPLSAVGTILSYPDAFRLLYEDQGFLRELLEFHTQSAKLWVEAVEQVFIRSGWDPGQFFIAEEIIPMISPAHAREFCLPYLQSIYQTSRAAIKVLHCDNRITHMPDVITGLGANVFFGNFSDYSLLKESFEGRMALMGNLPSLYVLTQGKPQDVEECARWLISSCGPGGGLILSSGGGLDPAGKTPLENINAMVQAARRFGKYPLTVKTESVPEKYRTIMDIHFSKSPSQTPPLENDISGMIARETCAGNSGRVREEVTKATINKASAETIFKEGLCRGLALATDRFYQADYFYPEMMRADLSYQAGLAALGDSFRQDYYRGTVIIGSLKGSYQETGIRGIQVMLQGAGFRVINLGTGIGSERFIEEAVKNRAKIIAMGVYFNAHVSLAEEVTNMVREKGLGIKTMAGGMGITPDAAANLAVDAYAVDGHQAQKEALKLVAGEKGQG